MGDTESRLAALRSGRTRTEPKFCKLFGEDIVWQPLSRQEEAEATAAAVSTFEKLGIPNDLHGYRDLDEVVRSEVLARAMRLPACPDVPFAADGTEVRKLLDSDSIDQLFAQYQDARDTLLPDPYALSEVERGHIVAAIKKKDPTVLESFGSCTLTAFILSTANQP